jgi:hypothetical protein
MKGGFCGQRQPVLDITCALAERSLMKNEIKKEVQKARGHLLRRTGRKLG